MAAALAHNIPIPPDDAVFGRVQPVLEKREEFKPYQTTIQKTFAVLASFFSNLNATSSLAKFTIHVIHALNLRFGLSLLPRLSSSLSTSSTVIDTAQIAGGIRDSILSEKGEPVLQTHANIMFLGAEIASVALFLNDLNLVDVGEFAAKTILNPIANGLVGIAYALKGVQSVVDIAKADTGKKRLIGILTLIQSIAEVTFRTCLIVGGVGTFGLAILGVSAAGMGVACALASAKQALDKKYGVA
ncbi:MAG: hypothetical protein WD595_02565 [Waddliaceae bacterium]